MHTVFSVDELLFHIFTLIGDTNVMDSKRQLAILARTCKTFNGVALRILWKDLDGVIPLFALLPISRKINHGAYHPASLVSVDTSFRYSTADRCCTTETKTLVGSMTPQCWDRFRVYAGLIRSLCINDERQIDEKLISAIAESLESICPMVLLPNLRRLQSARAKPASLLPLLLSPELLDLDLWASIRANILGTTPPFRKR
jgi:hypothetical protein